MDRKKAALTLILLISMHCGSKPQEVISFVQKASPKSSAWRLRKSRYCCRTKNRGSSIELSAEPYNSELLKVVKPPPLKLSPPAMRTVPFGNNVAVCHWRAILRLGVRLHVPVDGSYNSAILREEFEALFVLDPPAARTLPSGSSVAV